jgi:hypothetical protein
VSIKPCDALARINWQGRHKDLGLQMVNRDRESYFMYVEPFICMMERPDEYFIVKYRDSEPEKAIAHHGGAIWGDVEVVGETMTITLYFGALYKDIVYDFGSGDLLNVIGTQRYRFLSARLKSLVTEIQCVHDEQQAFEKLMMSAGCTPLQASFGKPRT